VTELINKQAEWSEEVKNYDAAAEMYIKVGINLCLICSVFPHAFPPPLSTQAKKYDKAIMILAKNAWWDKLIHVVRAVDKTDSRCLGMCATHFRRASQYQYAKETLLKMDDTKALISLYVEDNKWDDAFLLLHAHPGE
jgi:intraflagellar transport protein 122